MGGSSTKHVPTKDLPNYVPEFINSTYPAVNIVEGFFEGFFASTFLQEVSNIEV
jgi:hypothetical protein